MAGRALPRHAKLALIRVRRACGDGIRGRSRRLKRPCRAPPANAALRRAGFRARVDAHRRVDDAVLYSSHTGLLDRLGVIPAADV